MIYIWPRLIWKEAIVNEFIGEERLRDSKKF
jgi:hypothetical protein